MRVGVHLPLIDFAGRGFSLEQQLAVTRAAVRLGFSSLSVNDHLVFGRPWLDGLSALAVVLPESGDLQLMTSIALPTIRGPLALAKTLSALDRLSGGRVVAGVGPGSSARDYAAVGLDFEQRWARLDEAVLALRSLLTPGEGPFAGRFYSTKDVAIEPLPVQERLPIWIGSWGSGAGLRRVARLADGWLASAYNTTPETFRDARQLLEAELEKRGRDPGGFPNALATTIMFLTNHEPEAQRVLQDYVAPALNRPPEQIGDRILVCSPAEAVERLGRFAEAGLQQVLIWPALDEVEQLELFATEVAAWV